jgi:hypothetical protein
MLCAASFPLDPGGDIPHWLPISGFWWTLLAAVYAYGRSNPMRVRGRRELIIDPAARTLTLPPVGRRGDPQEIAFAQVDGVYGVGRVAEQPPWARGQFHLAITWKGKGKGKRSMQLGTAADRERADRFARWLKARIGLRK